MFPRKGPSLGSMGTVPDSSANTLGQIKDMMICPYDESHVVSAGRYTMHLKKCRERAEERARNGMAGTGVWGSEWKQHMKGELKECPYNRTHRIHESVMNKHIELCESYYLHCMETQELPTSMVLEESYASGAIKRPIKKISISSTSSSSGNDTYKEI